MILHPPYNQIVLGNNAVSIILRIQYVVFGFLGFISEKDAVDIFSTNSTLSAEILQNISGVLREFRSVLCTVLLNNGWIVFGHRENGYYPMGAYLRRFGEMLIRLGGLPDYLTKILQNQSGKFIS
jgi:hypothetical protein